LQIVNLASLLPKENPTPSLNSPPPPLSGGGGD